MIAAWAELSAGVRRQAPSGIREEVAYARLLTPRLSRYSASLSSLTGVSASNGNTHNQPVSDDKTGKRRIRISDVLGEADVDPFDEMLELQDHAQFLPSQEKDSSQFRCPPDSQVEFPGDEVNTAKARALLKKYQSVFTKAYQKEPAKVPPMQLRVDTAKWHTRENRLPPRTQSAERQQVIRDQYGEMLKLGIVRLCPEAEYYSQVLVVPKPHKDSETGEKLWRNCVDFKNLNNACNMERWPLPVIKEMLREIGEIRPRPRVFAKADYTHGFHQSPLALDSQIFTAFIVMMGILCWCRVPMGLKGAPSYFQNVMSNVLGAMLYSICRLYIDDILIWGDTNEALIENVERVLQRLQSHNIYLNPDKFYMGLSQIEYTGHVLDGEGIYFSREKLEKVFQIPLPKYDSEMKAFLGLAQYFHDHVRGFASIAAPLHELIRQYDKKRKKRIQYTAKAYAAFEEIKKAINECPKLYFIDPNLPIYLATDASDIACGAYLYQVGPDGKQIPILFTSHKFTETEKKWHTPDKEAYGIFYGVNSFQYLLRDVPFTIDTDHRNLVYMAESATPKVIRWKLALQSYDAHYEYIPGPTNVIPDALSRIVNVEEGTESSEEATHMCACLSCIRVTECSDTANFEQIEEEQLPRIDTNNPKRSQQWEWDESTHNWKRLRHSDETLPTHTSSAQPTVRAKRGEKRQTRKIRIRASRAKTVPIVIDGEVTRVLQPHERRQMKNLQPHELPQEAYRLLKRYHNDVSGHHGVDKTLQKLTEEGHSWPYMRAHVHMFIENCPMCQKLSHIKLAIQATRYTTVTYGPMERLNIDHMGPFPADDRGNIHILAIIDTFTRWIEFYPVKTTTAIETAECMLQHIGRFGSPYQILSDNGPAYVNEVIDHLGRTMDAEWIYTIAYSKEENAIVERSNRETLKHLRAILNHRKVRNNWSRYLPFVQRIMNATIKETIGVAPGTLLFGNALRLDTNILRAPKGADEKPIEGKPLNQWLANQLDIQQTVIDVARETQLTIETKRFDTSQPAPATTILQKGSYVLVQDPEGTDKPKLMPVHPGPYEIMGHRGDRYELRNLVNNGMSFVHISRLRPFKYDPIHTDPTEIALQDKEEFVVERILEHQGNIQDKTNMRFLVKWKGYDESSNSWEPWYDKGAGLRDNTVLHEYLRKRSWGFAIPKAQQQPGDRTSKR